jgi:hypothetical protein
MLIPAIHDFETGEAFVFHPAIGEGKVMAEPRTPDLIIVPRGRAVFVHDILL